MILVTPLARDMQQEFLDMSADYWREHLDMNSIFLAGAHALSQQQETIDRYLYSELLIETATDWGLSLKEDFYGLRDGIARSLDARRSRLRAAMRGGKALTIEDLEKQAGVFTGGLVDIEIDYDNFIYTIEFRDTYGIPERIEDVQQALARDIPAYYAIVYKFKFTTYHTVKNYFDDYAELKAANLTYKQLLVRKLDYDTYDEAEARYTTYDALEASGLTYEQLTRKEDNT
ncbi:putative phage tail protein [Exiguobacterium antarcticum]|uniref:putative phage tail protein n=1 Tax=Exiguobacterium antarcticum TaxID=132920 RepID=UPI00047A7E8B|nr:putative phage tail protein [Exiguobacterium antarcticum]